MASVYGYSSPSTAVSGGSRNTERVGIYQTPITRPANPLAPPELGPAPVASPGTTIGTAYGDFSRIFGPMTPIDPMRVARDIQGLFSQQPQNISAPTIVPAKVNFSEGAALQNAIYESQFRPVQRELQRQADLTDRAAAGQTAQSGLEDSMAGIAYRQRLARESGQRIEDASRDISASATATRIQTELSVAVRNAEFQQQARLAEAGFNIEGQKIAASNLLAGNGAAAEGYIRALGINADQANAYRAAFLGYLSEREKVDIARDTAAFDRYATLFNLMLQQKKIDSDAKLAMNEFRLKRDQLDLERERTALAEAESQRNFGLEQEKLDVTKGLGLVDASKFSAAGYSGTGTNSDTYRAGANILGLNSRDTNLSPISMDPRGGIF